MIKDYWIFVFIIISLITVELGSWVYVRSHSPAKVLSSSASSFDKHLGINIRSTLPTERVISASISAKSIASSVGSKNMNPTNSNLSNQTTSNKLVNVGIYENFDPGDPVSFDRLKEISQAGFNVVLNYNLLGGSVDQINTYLDKANSLGLKVIFPLTDFYSIDPNPLIKLSEFSAYGTTNDSVAIGIINKFKNKPALWGWYISDERPETLSDLAKWQPVLKDRFNLIKTTDPNHPTLIVLGCYEGQTDEARKMVAGLTSYTTDFGLDSYPIPFVTPTVVTECGQVVTSAHAQPGHRWFVVQDFSWQSYPDIIKSLGWDLSKSRLPTRDEMSSMVNQALNAGVENLLFYSYFDLKADPAVFSNQWASITSIVKSINQK